MNLLVTSVLARILTPKDYGVFVVAFVFTAFFQIIADFGLGSAVIQNKTLNKYDTDNIFSFTFRVAVVLPIFFFLFSFPMAQFYQNNAYIPIGILLSMSLFFNILNIIPNALLMKEKQFILIGVRTFAISLISSIFAIVLALIGFKYYALVLQSVFVGSVTFIWNYLSVKPKLIFKYDKNCVGKVREFSSYQLGFNVIIYFARNIDNLLVSKFMGGAALGYYDKAYKLMLYPVQNLTNVITPILHPILSDYQNDKFYIYQKYMRIVKILSLLGIWVSAICFFAADEIILIMFGEPWKDAIVPLKMLSLSVWAQMITSSAGAIFQSLGNGKIMFKSALISSSITIIFILCGLMTKDLVILSIFVAIGYNCGFIVNFYFLILKGFELKGVEFIKTFIPESILACFMGIVIWLYPFHVSNIYLSLMIKFLFITGVYVSSLFLTNQYKIFYDIAKSRKNKGISKKIVS